MSQYCTLQDVKDLGIMLPADVDQLESQSPGITAKLAINVSGLFDSWLQKRYETPFVIVPDALRYQVVQVVTYKLFLRRGFNPSSQDDQLIKQANDDAMAWLKSASLGDIELPLGDDQTANLDEMGMLSYTEAGPYTWMDVQRKRVRGDLNNDPFFTPFTP